MLDNRYQRGFSTKTLAAMNDPRVKQDERGYYIMSLSENSKVHFEDYYHFLELAYYRAQAEKSALVDKIACTPTNHVETISYYRARAVIVDQLTKAVLRFYTDSSTFGVVMTPWCFGTVVLEKIEVYRERISRGEAEDPNIPEYPFYVIRYIDEIYRSTLLDLFDFPESAFQMRWQYSELLKKYSKILTGITGSLQSVLSMIKSYGS
ncbi:MAG: hypothetical protein P1R58_06000 [bacterium]|nr:hypothetical protein [bacterium]